MNELTPEDKRTAERWASKLKKRARMWRWGRWAILAMWVVTMILAVHFVLLLDRSWESDELGTVLSRGPAKAEQVASYAQIRTAELRMQCGKMVMAWLCFAAGALAVGYVLVNWRSSERDLLLAKILRSRLTDAAQRDER